MITRASLVFAFAMFSAIAMGPASSQDRAEKGAALYRVCAACHSLAPGIHLTGPSLAGLWGNEAGRLEGFGRYSAALQDAGFAWNAETLDAWLADPDELVPGTAMTFQGMDNAGERQNLIAFLKIAMAPGGFDRVIDDRLVQPHMARGQVPPSLKAMPPERLVSAVRHCRDGYWVTTADGQTGAYWETNVRLKVDSSERGPEPGKPVIAGSGMMGDRLSIVFSNLSEMARFIEEGCE